MKILINNIPVTQVADDEDLFEATILSNQGREYHFTGTLYEVFEQITEATA